MQVFKSAGLMDRYERFKKGEALETLLAEAKPPTYPQPKPENPAKAKSHRQETPNGIPPRFALLRTAIEACCERADRIHRPIAGR